MEEQEKLKNVILATFYWKIPEDRYGMTTPINTKQLSTCCAFGQILCKNRQFEFFPTGKSIENLDDFKQNSYSRYNFSLLRTEKSLELTSFAPKCTTGNYQ